MAPRNIARATGMTYYILAPAFAALAVLGLSTAAQAQGTQINKYTDDACEVTDPDNPPPCGGIVYANKGAYVVKSVELNAKGDQPSGVPINPACAGMDKKFTKNVLVSQYETFVVPADCAYHLKINIESGPKKDQNYFLVPGCQIIGSTDGTVISNSWKHTDVDWTDAAKERAKESGTTLPEPPQDQQGNKCGKLGNM